MVIKREMSLDPEVFEVLSGVGGSRGDGVFERSKQDKKKKGVCVFQSASLPLSLSPLRIVIHELDLHVPELVCMCERVCQPVQE